VQRLATKGMPATAMTPVNSRNTSSSIQYQQYRQQQEKRQQSRKLKKKL
jgi:hypothetical protein